MNIFIKFIGLISSTCLFFYLEHNYSGGFLLTFIIFALLVSPLNIWLSLVLLGLHIAGYQINSLFLKFFTFFLISCLCLKIIGRPTKDDWNQEKIITSKPQVVYTFQPVPPVELSIEQIESIRNEVILLQKTPNSSTTSSPISSSPSLSTERHILNDAKLLARKEIEDRIKSRLDKIDITSHNSPKK